MSRKKRNFNFYALIKNLISLMTLLKMTKLSGKHYTCQLGMRFTQLIETIE